MTELNNAMSNKLDEKTPPVLDGSFFSGNRKLLKSLLDSDSLIVLTAQGLMQRSGDTAYPFRQDSNFYYLTGLTEPDIVLVMLGDEEFLILPKRTQAEDIFGGKLDCDNIAKISGVSKILDYQSGWERYKELQKSRKKIYTLAAPPPRISHTDSLYTNPARKRLALRLKSFSTSSQLIDIRPQVTSLRQVKQPAEVEAIQQAINITAEGFILAKENISNADYEYELETKFIQTFRSNGADHAYGPIIASGHNAINLHYFKNSDRLRLDSLVLMDVGAEYLGYAADITRTYISGSLSQRQARVHESVRAVFNEACLLLKPGIAWKEYVLAVDKIMGEHLMELGLIKNNDRTQVRRYFPHAISHSLGLDVHDICDYDVIKENMVITVEPGIYIPEEGIGVRVEDDILITKNGPINMSSKIAHSHS